MNATSAPPHALTLESRRSAALTGVTDVLRFDETEVVLQTHGGRLTLTGSDLHVSSLVLEEGRLLVDGTIDSVSYDGGAGAARGGFLRRALSLGPRTTGGAAIR